jgi:(p)ppGpp synthase/HD superfamily hydrolase
VLRALAISALLHDVVEDTDATIEDVRNLFGEYVAQVVLALSHVEEEEPDAVYLGRVAQGGECAVLVKRYDKLDNLHSLVLAPTAFREKKIRETCDALPLWDVLDPEGVGEIRAVLTSVQVPKYT